MPAAFEIKGWCPSAHRPMASGDGLLIRAKSKRSALTSAQLRAIADIATDCGNGLIDLTQRAQLQLRGLSTGTLDEARRRLQEAALYFPAEDSLVDVLTAGPLDVSALAQTLAHVKQRDDVLRALPPKFLISIETGASASLADARADIRIAMADAAQAAIGVGAAPDVGVIVQADEIAPTARKLMRAFLALRAERPFELRRMSHVVAARGLDALLREAELEAQPFHWRAPNALRSVLGARQAEGAVSVGLAAPCGRWRTEQLVALAGLAGEYGAGHAAPTHLRAFLIPARDMDAARKMLDAARALDLILSDDDPRRAVVACPGAPECSQARGETRAALARLAPLAQKIAGRDGVGLHVSGCAKGCARPDAAPATLVADDGRFDLVENGGASDAPVLRGLDMDAAENALRARAEGAECPTP